MSSTSFANARVGWLWFHIGTGAIAYVKKPTCNLWSDRTLLTLERSLGLSA
ncbi:MAG TPA: hypothetical protein V6C90_05175 [Coleofasciculaceae cyanobacterium]